MKRLEPGSRVLLGQWDRGGRIDAPAAVMLDDDQAPKPGDPVVAAVTIGQTGLMLAGVLVEVGCLLPAVPGMVRIQVWGGHCRRVKAFIWED